VEAFVALDDGRFSDRRDGVGVEQGVGQRLSGR
jgi:hypothetical protein